MTPESQLPLKMGDHIKKMFSVGAGRVLAQLLNLLVIPVILRFISPADYSALTILQTASLIYGVIMSFGLSTAFMSRFSKEDKAKGGIAKLLGSCISQQFVLGGVLFIISLGFTIPVSRMLVGDSNPFIFILLIGSEYLSNHVLIISRWQILTDRHWQVSLTAFLRSCVYLALSLIFVGAMGLGIFGLAIADFLSRLGPLVLNLFLARDYLSLNLKLREIYLSIRLGIPAAPDTIFFWIIVSTPLYFLRRVGQMDAAGYFSLAWRIASPIDVLGNSLASAAARQLLDSGQKQNSVNLRHIFRFAINILVFGILGLNLLIPDFFKLFFPSDYQSAFLLLPYISLGYFFLGLYYFEWLGLSGSKFTFGLSIASGLGAAVGLVVCYGAGNSLDGTIASGAYASSFLVMWIAARMIRPGIRFGKIWQLIAVGLLITGLILILHSLSFTLLLAITFKTVCFILILGIGLCVELWIRMQEHRKETGRNYRFHEIPTYHFIANQLTGGVQVLDIGCSEGFFLREIETQYKVGVDINLELLRQGKKEDISLNMVCAEASALPFPPESFDRITLIGVLPYVKDVQIVVRSAAVLLKPGGKIIISAISDYPIYRFINFYGRKYHLRYFKEKELVNIIYAAGLENTQIAEKGYLVAPVFSIAYSLTSFIDKYLYHSHTVLGKTGRWARAFTNPLIQWEYDSIQKPGYQYFVTAEKYESD